MLELIKLVSLRRSDIFRGYAETFNEFRRVEAEGRHLRWMICLINSNSTSQP